MPQIVNHPQLGTLVFGDDVSVDEINRRIEKALPIPANERSMAFYEPGGFGTIGERPSARDARVVEQQLPTIARIGIPLAAAPFTSGMSTLPMLAAQGAASALGEIAGQAAEGGGFRGGDVTRAAITGGAGSYLPTWASRSIAQSLPAKAGEILAKGGVGATIQGGAGVAGELAKAGIEGNLGERAANLGGLAGEKWIDAAIGFGFGIGSGIGQAVRKTDADRKVAVEIFGRQELPPEAIDLAFAGAARRRTEATGVSAMDPITESMASRLQGLAGTPPVGAELTKQLAPYAGAIDDVQSKVAALRNDVETKRQLLEQARQNYGDVQGDVVAKAESELAAARRELADADLSALRNEAFKLQQAKLGDAYVDFATLRNLYVERVQKPLDEFLTNKSKAMYEAVGVPGAAPLIDGSDIERAIDAAALAKSASPEETASITNRIRSRIIAGKNENNEFVYRQLSLNDVRSMRSDLQKMLVEASTGTTRANSLVNAADAQIAAATRRQIEKIAGDSALKAYDEANAYWRNYSRARQNPLARVLMARTPNDESVQTMVSKLVQKGPGSDEYVGVNRYIEAVADGAPEVQAEMKSQIMSLVRGGVVAKNMKGGIVDVDGLANDIASMERNKFSVSDLRLGTAKELRTIASLANKAGLSKSQLTQEQLTEIIESPGVQDAILSGRNFSVAASKPIAEIAAVEQIRAGRFMESAGLAKRAQELYNKANANLTKSNADFNRVKAKLDTLEADPIAVAMSGGKNFGLTGKVQQDFDSFIGSILNPGATAPDDVKALMVAIDKKSPELRENIAMRAMHDRLKWVTENARTGGKTVEYKRALEEMADTEYSNRLRIVLGNERYSKLEGMRRELERLNAIDNAANLRGTVVGLKEAAVAARGAATGSMTGGSGFFVGSVLGLLERGRYKAASVILSKPDVWRAYSQIGNLEKAIETLGVQRATMLYQNMPGLREEVATP